MYKIGKYTIDISGTLEEKLHNYMSDNKIKKRSVAIKKCIEDATSKETDKSFMIELDKKLNRILYRQNLNKKVLDQLFANMGFGTNMNVEADLLLKKIYDDNNSRFTGGFG